MKKSQLLLETIGIEVEEDKNGKLILGEYRQPSANFKFDDIGINEDKLFKDIVEIKGNADFEFSKVANLGNLQSIGGNANFTCSNVKSLGNLQSIEKDAYIANSHLTKDMLQGIVKGKIVT